MAVYSKFAAVLKPDGTPLQVRQALQMINEAAGQYHTEGEGTYDTGTQFCVSWFDDHGFGEGPYGNAETVALAKNVVVSELGEVLSAVAGKVALLPLSHYRERHPQWDPANGTTVWAACHFLAAALEDGEEVAGGLAYRLGGLAFQAIALAHRLYLTCEAKGWTDESLIYNGLTASWARIQSSDAYTQGSQAELL